MDDRIDAVIGDVPGRYGREHLYLFGFGAYGWTRVAVFARGIEDGLEIAAGWLADHDKRGHFHDPDYADAAADLGHTIADPARWTDGLDDDQIQKIAEKAEADLTYTESGYLASWEWTVNDVDDPTMRRALAFRLADETDYFAD